MRVDKNLLMPICGSKAFDYGFDKPNRVIHAIVANIFLGCALTSASGLLVHLKVKLLLIRAYKPSSGVAS